MNIQTLIDKIKSCKSQVEITNVLKSAPRQDNGEKFQAVYHAGDAQWYYGFEDELQQTIDCAVRILETYL
jgi:hypothetical protein